jgi:hypothetical protein
MIVYIFYIILIFIILKLFKNYGKNSEIISSILICIGIYIINLLIPQKNKEHFGNNCGNQHMSNGCNCDANNKCKSFHCRDGKCRNKIKICGQCNEGKQCNKYDNINNIYKTKFDCIEGICDYTNGKKRNKKNECGTNLTSNGVTSSTSNGVPSSTSNGVTSSTSNGVTSSISNNVPSSTSNGVTSSTSNGVTSSTSNDVTSYISNGLTSFTSNGVTSSTSNGVTSSTSNGVTSSSLNTVQTDGPGVTVN